jgi:hypothetical protein
LARTLAIHRPRVRWSLEPARRHGRRNARAGLSDGDGKSCATFVFAPFIASERSPEAHFNPSVSKRDSWMAEAGHFYPVIECSHGDPEPAGASIGVGTRIAI